MRRESKAEREAWTAHVDGVTAKKTNKYGAEPTDGFASKHEAKVAGQLDVLARRGIITELKYQVRFVLVEGMGRIRPIVYVADFTYIDQGKLHVLDAKGYTKNPVYRLKKKLLLLLHGIEIEEV